MKAFILAGGLGTRLRSITKDLIPKPMVKINNKPVLEHTLELLTKYGIKDIILSIGHLGEQIIEYFGNGSKWGANIMYIKEDYKTGTAGALRLAKPFLNSDEGFIMINGDNLYNINIDKMKKIFFNNYRLATIALTRAKDVTKYGVADVTIYGVRIKKFVEKPTAKEAPSDLVNAGFYMFQPEVLAYVPNKKYSMIETEVFPQLLRDEEFYGYVMEKEWYPVGTPEEYKIASEEWK